MGNCLLVEELSESPSNPIGDSSELIADCHDRVLCNPSIRDSNPRTPARCHLEGALGSRAHCGMSCEPQYRFFGPYAMRHAVIGSSIGLDSCAE